MGTQNGNDFAVDSEGHCFLCSNKVSYSRLNLPWNNNIIRDELTVRDSRPNPIYSFHNVSKYLNMDMTKVFSETGGIPPQLLAKVQASRLKVELCEGCAALNETFSKLHRRLEKIEMEVASCLTQMYGKLSAAKEQELDSRMTSGRDVSEKSKILKALRNEASEKCFTKLAVGSPTPRIKLRKLTLKLVNAERSKLQSSSHPKWMSRNNRESGRVPIENCSDENMDNSNTVTYDDDNYANNEFDENDGEPNKHDDDGQVAMQVQTDDEVADGAYYSTVTKKDETTPKVKIDETLYTVSAETCKYKCNSCSKELKDLKCFGSHYRTMHLKIRYKCSMCGKVLQTNTNYHRHVQTAHLGTKFKCQTCGKVFNRKDNLKYHQRLKNCAAEMASTEIKDEPIS